MRLIFVIIFLFLLPVVHSGLAATGHRMKTIKGKVKDYHTGSAVKNIQLEIAGTNLKCKTNSYGAYKFELPDTFSLKTVIIKTAADAQPFLDETTSYIPDKKVIIDCMPSAKEMVLYRFPIQSVPGIDVVVMIIRD